MPMTADIFRSHLFWIDSTLAAIYVEGMNFKLETTPNDCVVQSFVKVPSQEE